MEVKLKELKEAIEFQRQKVYKIAVAIIPFLTEEDVLQPFDYPELIQNAEFLYEEGVLHGMEQSLVIFGCGAQF